MKWFSKKKPDSLSTEELESAVRAALAEDESPLSAPTGHIPLTHRTAAKAVAFLLAILMTLLTALSALAAIFMFEEELYTTSKWSYEHNAYENIAYSDIHTLALYLSADEEIGTEDAAHYLSDRNVAHVEMTFSEGPTRQWDYDGGMTEGNWEFSGTLYHIKHLSSRENWFSRNYPGSGGDLQVLGTVDYTIRLAKFFNEQDTYFFADKVISTAYALRYWVYAIGAAACLLSIACFVFLMCASGRRYGLAEPQPGWGTKIPLDFLVAAAAIAVCSLVAWGTEATYWGNTPVSALLLAVCAIGVLVVALGLCMSFALRIKLGGWWKNTLCFYALRLSWSLLKKLCVGARALGAAVLRGFRGLGNSVLALFRGIPLVRQAVYLYLCFVVTEGLLLLLAYVAFYDEGIIIVWTLVRIILLPAVILYALMLRKLQKGGEALAAGDLSYQVDTARMPWSYKAHGENLNSIAVGMTAAVEQRMRSERMKTELITNVSHDIKTPLTSIINYSDLIGKEPCENEKITEYAEVLHRQSERLKRLIDDLVEASKASTGNLEVLLAPCEVGVMLTQTAGEYEQRLEQSQLSLITKQPEAPVRILADGRRLWRVFDNLMNNICKYAQPGTRVYLTLEEMDGHAVISFKNTSREALNLTAEELMERFVQGDLARRTEGNGLGLSIARSLVELQHGTLDLTVDGDLFKVVLTFSVLSGNDSPH